MTQRETTEQAIETMTQAVLHSLQLKSTSIARVREQLALSQEMGKYGFPTPEWNTVCTAVLDAAEAYAAQQAAPEPILVAAIEPLPLSTMVARASAKLAGKTLVQKVGDYTHKGDTGIYVQIVGTQRYAAMDWVMLPDEQFPAIRRGEPFEASGVVIEETYERIDQCLE